MARKLQEKYGDALGDYTVVDFCSGAGGPTVEIERAVNLERGGGGSLVGEEAVVEEEEEEDGEEEKSKMMMNGISDIQRRKDALAAVEFVLTDLHPHTSAWREAVKLSDHLHYVPSPIDASAAPPNLLSLAEPPLPSSSSSSSSSTSSADQKNGKKQLHIFSLAFHHFDKPLALRILKNILSTSHAFCIFELQARTLDSLIVVTMTWPLLWAFSWYHFWGNWDLLFWIYIVPIVPFVVVFDGWVSSLRTRWGDEVRDLILEAGGEGELGEGWKVNWGGCKHSRPFGDALWIFGKKGAKEG